MLESVTAQHTVQHLSNIFIQPTVPGVVKTASTKAPLTCSWLHLQVAPALQ